MADKEVLSDADLYPQTEKVEKAAISSSTLPSSILNRQQADRFIDLCIDYTTLLKKIRVVRKDHPSGVINKLDIGGIVSENAASLATATTRTPTESVVNYDTAKYRSAFDLPTDFTEDNLERGAVRNTLLTMFTKGVANDLELTAVQADASLTMGIGQGDTNNLLGGNDGFKEILNDNVPGGQQIDAGGAGASKALYHAMIQAIPARYSVSEPDYVFVASQAVANKWMLEVSSRATPYGDNALKGMVEGPFGIKMLKCPRLPQNLTFGTAGTDGTVIWLTPLDNLILIWQRKVTIEWQRQPRTDTWECTIHWRVDFAVENAAMVVLAENVSLSGTDYA